MPNFSATPTRTALINVDMQNCFLEGYPISAPDGLIVLERVNRLAAACRKAGVLVIHASIVVRADGSNLGVLGEFSQPVKDGILNKGSESSALHQGLVIDPARYSPRQAPLRRIPRHRSRINSALARHRHSNHRRRSHKCLLRNHRPRSRRPRFPRFFPERRHRHRPNGKSLRRTIAKRHLHHARLSIRRSPNSRSNDRQAFVAVRLQASILRPAMEAKARIDNVSRCQIIRIAVLSVPQIKLDAPISN